VVGNPPYDVLAEREAGPRIAFLRAFIRHDPSLAASVVGKNNLYKLFLCRALELTRDGGYISFIVPMPFLGDEQALGIRRDYLSSGTFNQIHAFPQKDNPARRVFRDAKLSTALFSFRKGDTEDADPFPSVRHTANTIDSDSPFLTVRTTEIPLYDPSNFTIVSCGQDDWDLAVRIAQRPGIRRLGALCKSFQGEVNETTHVRFLADQPDPDRTQVLRGSNVCMYVLRDASQGEALYLDAAAYQAAFPGSEKAFHSRVGRVGFQRSAPQNNYRRVIAARIPAGEFCFDTVSYIPQGAQTLVDLDLLLAVLNSRLVDWYFTIGSTNSKVNEYQFNNLPFPAFRQEMTSGERAVLKEALPEIERNPSNGRETLAPLFAEAPVSPALGEILIRLSQTIQKLEAARGPVSRAERAKLAPVAQPHQDLIDSILFGIVGFSETEAADLAGRLERMA
jgi:hypothetical protein